MTRSTIEGHVWEMIKYLGEDPDRPGIDETPKRVVKAWDELFSGYKSDPRVHLKKRFQIRDSQMVSLNGVEFFSTCEHHMLPFFGTADVAYIPHKEVCGLSKLARVLDGYSRRLQMQETLTDQVAQAIQEELEPLGVAVRVRAQHMCMIARGAKSSAATMVTTVLLGHLRSSDAKQEWLASLPA